MIDRTLLISKSRGFLFEYKVVLLFTAVTLFAFFASGVSTILFFNELFTRFGRNSFMVLSLLIPVVAGLGLNFGIVIGAMAAQIAVFLVVLWGGQGILGVASAVIIATPIAILLGYLIGRLFNNMKGSEMIGGMVTALFADGFYQFFFLFVMGGVIAINNAQLMIPTGVGVVNAIDLDRDNNMRQALDNVSIYNILTIAIWIILILIAVFVAFSLWKKQPIKMRGRGGLLRLLIAAAALWLTYGLSFVIAPLLTFLYYDRVNGLVGVRLVALVMLLYAAYCFIRVKLLEKQGGSLSKAFSYLALAVIIFVITLAPEISRGLDRVRIPVFTYSIIIGLCFFINWFLTTRLGQNMRTVGHDRGVATAAGIDVDKTRIIAMIMSTLLAAYGQIIMLQNFGVLQVYGAHSQVGLYAIAALLVGGATVSRASVKHAILGVILFHSLFILAPMAGNRLMGSALIGEYFRVVVANAVIAIALIMHAWKWIANKRKAPKPGPQAKAALA